jgi:hypothetical protein
MQKTGEKSYPRRSTPVEVTPRQLPLFDQWIAWQSAEIIVEWHTYINCDD